MSVLAPCRARPCPRPVAPDRVEWAGAEAVIGRARHALLSCVLLAGLSAPVGEVLRAVCGEASRSGSLLRVHCHRLNKKFAELGCPARLCIDDGRVLLI